MKTLKDTKPGETVTIVKLHGQIYRLWRKV